MDPSIMKLLEEDEDETMHSGADVEAFTAALNRDIEGDNSSSHPSDLDPVVSQGNHPTSSQLFSQWQTCSLAETNSSQGQEELKDIQQPEQPSSEMETKQHDAGNQHQQQIDTSQGFNHLSLQQKQSQNDHNEHHTEQKPVQFSQSTGKQVSGCHTEQTPFQFSQSTGMQISENNTVQSTVGMQQKTQDDSQQWQEQIAHQFPQTKGVQISERNHVSISEPDRIYNPNSESQYLKLQTMNREMVTPAKQVRNPPAKQVPFGMLLPGILSQLDKDRAMQLQTLYARLKKNEVPKDGFVRLMKGIVGDQMLKMAVLKLQSQQSSGPNHFQLHSQASAQAHSPKMGSSSSQEFLSPHSLQFRQKGHSSTADLSRIPASSVQLQSDSRYNDAENSPPISQETEQRTDSKVVPVSQMSSSSLNPVNLEGERCTTSIQGPSKQQQQHFHFPQTPFPSYGSSGANYQQYSGTNVNASTSSVRPQSLDTQARQVPLHQSIGPPQLGGSSQGISAMSLPKFDKQNSINDHKKAQVGSRSNLTSSSTLQKNSVPRQPFTSTEQNSAALSSVTYVKDEPVEQTYEHHQKSQSSAPQGLSSFSAVQFEQVNATPVASKDEPKSLEKQPPRMVSSTSTTALLSNTVSSSMTHQMDHNVLFNPRITSTPSPAAGTNVRTPPKKPSAGQKKPLEALGSSPPLASKKQKVSGAFSDQSIEQLNDVTAVSGVNLREEEEQLFSGPKEDNRVSDLSRRFVQEEEERLILQRTPLQKKLEEIMANCGITSISNDVERCLSLSVEERLRGLISNLIRLSKQRIDSEKPRHRTFITSDVRQQILLINRKAREECEKKQAEEEKLRKLLDPEDVAMDGDKERDEGRVRSMKSNKEEDDKMRTTAANVAARAAVGGDDMLSKWQLMAEQARQKREVGTDATSGSHPGKEASSKLSPSSGRNARDKQEAERRGNSPAAAAASGVVKKFGRNHPIMPQARLACNISMKDVIAALEREPQMSKSSLIYRLYERVHTSASE